MALYLLPNLLAEEANPELFLPASVAHAVRTLDGLIAESEKGGRHYLRHFLPQFRDLPLRLLNEHTQIAELEELIAPCVRGETWGVVSDQGLPCLADPGADLVALAHRKKVPVEVFAGPSSLIFALMLSGLSAQAFAFHGYLEREAEPLKKQIKALEERSQHSTQVCIEAPYRSQKLLETFVSLLHPNTRLCIASDLTLPTQLVLSQPIRTWKAAPLPSLKGKPTVFLWRGEPKTK